MPSIPLSPSGGRGQGEGGIRPANIQVFHNPFSPPPLMGKDKPLDGGKGRVGGQHSHDPGP